MRKRNPHFKLYFHPACQSVEKDPISLLKSQFGQKIQSFLTSEQSANWGTTTAAASPELRVGERALRGGDGAVPHDGPAVALAGVDVAVERVVAHAQAAAHKPGSNREGGEASKLAVNFGNANS